ncbi:MAG TPA: FAD-linked oxidase C-terminal domain-containing protein [Actinomycetales bacterium]|nr:FAD-linked oxidase C-terminal domain-containing protein [Actinomycetales bacterium]
MTATDLPRPAKRPDISPELDVGSLVSDLQARVDGEIRFDAGSRSAYSTDGSNYHQVPIGVVVPRTVDAAADAITVCREHRAPVLSRGGGTSLAGECTNTAVVIDWSKYCNRLLSVDADQRTCVVEPGIVLDHLNDLLSPHELEFGPKPSTHDHCTLGGMISNNSCGATAQRAGKTADNTARLEVQLYDGTRMWVGPTSDEEFARIVSEGGRRAEVYLQMRALRDHYMGTIRTRFPKIPRRVSGYNLDALLPENGFDVAKALVGSEGTLVTVLRAELKLVPVLKRTVLVVLSYPDIATAGDDVPRVLKGEPTALEGIDDQIIDFERSKKLHPEAMHYFPKGKAFLISQHAGDTLDQAKDNARRMVEGIGRSMDGDDVEVFDDVDHQEQIWRVRESGLGATARVPGLPDTWPGWEDSAVDPNDLGDYLRDLSALFDKYGYTTTSLYGHFGQACVHCRIPFDLRTAPGIKAFRSFMEEAADLVSRYGGSLSGEHGDGQARAELLPRMFGDEVVEAFGRFKGIFDPENLMNPGKVADPYPLDGEMRLGTDFRHPTWQTHFQYTDDEGSFSRAVLRCVGVGECRREGGEGVMCPSYMVTRDEEHSTRGRSRLLFEMLDGTARGGVLEDGWRSDAVRDALDLCLACKGCKRDCPVHVDMATYKAEFLSHHYAGRLRPLTHYSMGWLPVWAAVAGVVPGVVNATTHNRHIGGPLKKLAGVDDHRTVPTFAKQSLQRWYSARGPRGDGRRGELVLWPDTFTNRFHPQIGRAAVEVLESAGWRVVMPTSRLCCGLTWISTGQLKTAKRVIQRTVSALRPHIRAGTPMVGLEPSCTAVFLEDAPELFSHDDDVLRLRDQTFTLAEFLLKHTDGWDPPHVDRDVVVQTHCHQHAVMGYDDETELMKRMGARPNVLDSGCCGLAGDFGFTAGHYDVSMACAERVLLPAIRAADPATVVLADGFSCRTQIEQSDVGRRGGGRHAIHLAELLRMGLDGTGGSDGTASREGM